MLVAAVLLLPLIICAPSPPTPNQIEEELVGLSDTFHCLRQCFGMNTVNVEPTAGEQRCMRLVDSRSLWDKNTSEITIEGPRRGVYSTRIISSPSLSVSLRTVEIDHTMPSDGAYSQCVRKCLDVDTVAPEECKEGQREFGLITSGKEEGYDWSAFYGYGCQTIHTIITTYEEEVPILIDDGDVGIFLQIRDGEMNGEQITFGKEEEESSTGSSEIDEEDEESTTEDTDDYSDEEKEEESTEATDDYDDEEEGGSTDDRTDDYVQTLAEWLPCPFACLNRENESIDQFKFTPLAMNYREASDGGNWWYSRYTVREKSNTIATLIDHNPDTKIRFGGEAEGKEFNHTIFDEKLATCLSTCFGKTQNEFIQSCSESVLIPTWTVVDVDASDGYGRMTLAIPLSERGCHSYVTFAFTTKERNPIRILYARDEEEFFSIESGRAISRIVHTTNSSLLSADS